MTEDFASDPLVSRARIFSFIAGIMLACVIAGILFGESSSGAREMGKRASCAVNLKAIATACLIYAETRQCFPTSLDTLLVGGSRAYLQPKRLICPESNMRYILVPSHGSADPRDVLLYEAPPSHDGRDGGNVAYRDGHVAWCSSAQLREDLMATRQRRPVINH